MHDDGRPLGRAIRLDTFNNSWYSPGGSALRRALWFFFGQPFLAARWQPLSNLRRGLLRLFGARIGKGVVIKPGVRIKYPWRLSVGDHVWIGEDCWIDNLADVSIGSHACLSQDVYLCTGNHDWSDRSFGLRPGEIVIGNGSWIGARAVLGPGVQTGDGSIAALGSVVNRAIPAWEVHAGNPAQFVRTRHLSTSIQSNSLPSTSPMDSKTGITENKK